MILALALLLQDKWEFEDKLAAKAGKGWAWLREAAGGWKFEKNALLIKPQPGTLAEATNTAKNLFWRPLLPLKDGAMCAEVVVASAPAVDGEEAGILFYLDDDTWVKLARGRESGKVQSLFVRERGGVLAPLGQREEPAASYKLRLRLEDRRVQAEVLPAGAAKWYVAGYCESPFEKAENVKVALYAQGAPADAARWASFSEFKMGWAAHVDR